MMRIRSVIFCVLAILLTTEKLGAASITWKGTTSTTWSVSTNWNGGVVPGTGDIAVFNSTWNNPCVITTAIDVAGIDIVSTYTSSVTQNAVGVTLGASGFVQAGGLYTAAAAGLGAGFVCNGNFTISGGTFAGSNSTSLFVLMAVYGDFSQTGGTFTPYKRSTFLGDMTKGSTGTFSHNSGFIGVGGTNTISLLNVSFYDFRVTATSTLACTINIAQDLIVANDMEIAGADNPVIINTSASKKIKLAGDLTISNTYTTVPGGGTGTILFDGSGAQQINSTITSDLTGKLCNVEINKTGGSTLSLANVISIAGNLTYTAGGISAGTSTIVLTNNAGGSVTASGTMTLNALTFSPTAALTVTISHTITANGGVNFAGGSNNLTVNNGTVSTRGTVTVTNTGTSSGGTTLLNMNNTGAQTLTGNGGITNGFICNLTTGTGANVSVSSTVGVNSLTIVASSTVSPGSNGIGVKGNWTNNGTFTPGTSLVTFKGNNNNQTITASSGTMTFNDVEVAKTGSPSTLSTAVGTNTVTTNGFTLTSGIFTAPATLNINSGSASTLTLSAGTFTAGSAINITGNWTKASGATFTPGSGTVTFTGTGAQAINGTSTSQTFNHVVIAKSAGTTLSVSGSTTTLRTNDLTQTTGNFTAPATLSIDAGSASTLTLSAGTFTAGSTIGITGDWTKASGATFTPGSGTVTFTGTGTQAINGTSTSQTFNHVVISKTAGTTLSVSGSTATLTTNNLTETTGNFTAPANLNINAGAASNLTLSAGTFTAGSNINITGNWTKASGATFAPGGTGTVTFTGSGAQTINGTSASQTFNHLTISKSGGTTLSVSGSTTTLATNNLTQTTGNFTAPATLNINVASASKLILTAGTFTAGSNININGDWTKASGATFTQGSGTVTFTGTGAQTINGTSTSQTFNHVVIAKTAGTTLTVSGSTTTLTTNNLTETTGNFTAPATLNISAATASSLTISAGTFTAGSLIRITGNWTDNGTFVSGTGTVKFQGSSGTQTISRSSGTEDFYNLHMDRTVATDRVDFSCPLIINHDLNFIKGVLKTTNTSDVLINNDATASNASDLSYIQASVQKVGDDAFTFPLGNNSQANPYHPLTISAPSDPYDIFTATYYSTGQTDGSSIDNLVIDDLSNCEYWNLSRDAGTSNVTVGATWSASSCMIAADPTQMCLAKWDGSQWKKEGEYVSGTTVASPAVISIPGHFTLAKKACYVKQLATPLSISGPATVCSGAPTVSLVASVTPPAGTYVFSWTAPVAVSGNTYTITPFASGSPVITSYTAKVEYLPLTGCFATKTHTLTVIPGPLVSAGLDQDVAISTPATLNGAVTGGATPYSYAWTPTTYMSPSAGNILTPTVTLTSATVVIYTLTVTDNNSCTGSDQVVVSAGQTQFAIVKKKMNGGFFLSQSNKLYFKFDGEYISGTGVDYTVFDETNTIVTGTALTNLATSSNAWQYGDNRYELDITSIPSGQYTLEVSNEKNERFYLRFKK